MLDGPRRNERCQGPSLSRTSEDGRREEGPQPLTITGSWTPAGASEVDENA